MSKATDTCIALWLALFLFGVYLLSFSGVLYSQDSMSMFAVTESWVKRGEFTTDQLWTLFKARNEIAADGESYAKYGYGTSLFIAPLYAFALYLPLDLGLTQTALLTSAIAIATAGALVYLSARALNYTRAVATITALLFGLATPAWVYAKQLWSEPYALVTLFAAFYFLQRFRTHAHPRDALIAGWVLGLGIATRVTNVALVPLYAWYGFGGAWRDARTRRGLGGFIFSVGLILLSIGWYDWVRYGNPLSTGYRADETFDTPFVLGTYGLLFSPGKGLFLYVPFLAALAFAALAFFRRAQRETIFIGGFFAFYLVLFSLWYYWWSGPNWGPRFLVPTLPFLVLMIAPAIEYAQTHRRFAFVFASLCILSFYIQFLGISVPMLGYYRRLGRFSATPAVEMVFSPLASPLVGAWNLFKPSVLDFAWLHVVDNQIQIDGFVIITISAFLLGCATMLYRPHLARCSRSTMLFVSVVLIGISLFSMYRYRHDVRFGGNTGYRALLQTLAREERSNDVMILNDDTRAPFFFNENRARMRWYGLSRDPHQFDTATQALLARITKQHTRTWFVYDDATADLPDPTREWLDTHLYIVATYAFDNGVHLVLYQSRTQHTTDSP